jgi:hypothetical protein
LNAPESNVSQGDLRQLLRSMQPRLNGGIYVYTVLPAGLAVDMTDVLATFRETEGLTAILPEPAARAAGLPILFRCAWITLTVDSALDAVGFTAAFSRALGDAGISCNVMAAAHHDHVFVPFERAAQALDCLRALQASA